MFMDLEKSSGNSKKFENSNYIRELQNFCENKKLHILKIDREFENYLWKKITDSDNICEFEKYS